jgi:hypothetical protein
MKNQPFRDRQFVKTEIRAMGPITVPLLLPEGCTFLCLVLADACLRTPGSIDAAQAPGFPADRICCTST